MKECCEGHSSDESPEGLRPTNRLPSNYRNLMKTWLIAAAVLAIVAYSLWPETHPQPPYNRAQLTQERRQKDADFRSAAASPLPLPERARFGGLKYFTSDSVAAVSAEIQRFERPDTVQMALSQGSPEAYVRWGRATFDYPATLGAAAATAQRLTLFRRVREADSTLFVPFTDGSNGRGTYGGGRYLDVPLPAPAARQIVLDFNRAYNPFCAYNPDYRCPVPPPENRLSVVISAGEKAFHD